MSFFRHVRPLFTTSLTTEDKIGPVYAVLPADSDTTPDHAMEMRLMVQLPTPPVPIRGGLLPGGLGTLGCVPCTVPVPVPVEPVVPAPVTPAPVVPAPAVPIPAPVAPAPVLPPLLPSPAPGAVLPTPSPAPLVYSPVPVLLAPAPSDPVETEEPEPVEVPEEPKALAIIETSTNRVSWSPAAGPFALDLLPVFTDTVVLGPYVRARTVSSGVSHEVEVRLLSNASFRLELA